MLSLERANVFEQKERKHLIDTLFENNEQIKCCKYESVFANIGFDTAENEPPTSSLFEEGSQALIWNRFWPTPQVGIAVYRFKRS